MDMKRIEALAKQAAFIACVSVVAKEPQHALPAIVDVICTAVNEVLEEAKRIAIDYRDGGELAPQRIEEEIEALKLP